MAPKRQRRMSAPDRRCDEDHVDETGHVHRANVQHLLDQLENNDPQDNVEKPAEPAAEKHGKRCAECWQYGKKTGPQSWQCILCHQDYAGGATRLTYVCLSSCTSTWF